MPLLVNKYPKSTAKGLNIYTMLIHAEFSFLTASLGTTPNAAINARLLWKTDRQVFGLSFAVLAVRASLMLLSIGSNAIQSFRLAKPSSHFRHMALRFEL